MVRSTTARTVALVAKARATPGVFSSDNNAAFAAIAVTRNCFPFAAADLGRDAESGHEKHQAHAGGEEEDRLGVGADGGASHQGNRQRPQCLPQRCSEGQVAEGGVHPGCGSVVGHHGLLPHHASELAGAEERGADRPGSTIDDPHSSRKAEQARTTADPIAISRRSPRRSTSPPVGTASNRGKTA